MEFRRQTGRLGERLALAALLLTVAGLVWLAGVLGAVGSSCAEGAPDSTGAAASAWPPGKECVGAGGPHIERLFGGIEWVIVGLALIGAAVGLLAVVAEIRRLRGNLPRRWTSRSPTSRAAS